MRKFLSVALLSGLLLGFMRMESWCASTDQSLNMSKLQVSQTVEKQPVKSRHARHKKSTHARAKKSKQKSNTDNSAAPAHG